MGGFLGIGGSGGPDKQLEAQSRSDFQNIFNYGLPAGQTAETTGQNTLDQAKGTLGDATSYWRSLLTPGRATATMNAAPATNAALDQADAAKRQAAQFGSGRSGGAAATDAERGVATNAHIDDIINQNMMGGRQQGAQGLASSAALQSSIGGEQLQNAMQLLGLGANAQQSILSNAAAERAGVRNSQTDIWGKVIQGLL